MAEKFIKCTFEGSLKEYSYKTHIEGIMRGDRLIVSNKSGLRIVTATEYCADPQLPSSVRFQWAIAKLHETSYDAMKASGINSGSAE